MLIYEEATMPPQAIRQGTKRRNTDEIQRKGVQEITDREIESSFRNIAEA